MLFVAATACTRVTTGYSIDLLSFFLVSSVVGLKVIKVRKEPPIVYHSTLPFMFCSDTTPIIMNLCLFCRLLLLHKHQNCFFSF